MMNDKDYSDLLDKLNKGFYSFQESVDNHFLEIKKNNEKMIQKFDDFIDFLEEGLEDVKTFND